jgi:hypothetical protein
MELSGQDKIRCCPKDLMDELRDSGLRADIAKIRNILKDSLDLRSEKNGEYIFYHIGIEGELFLMKRKGRYLEISHITVDKILL